MEYQGVRMHAWLAGKLQNQAKPRQVNAASWGHDERIGVMCRSAQFLEDLFCMPMDQPGGRTETDEVRH